MASEHFMLKIDVLEAEKISEYNVGCSKAVAGGTNKEQLYTGNENMGGSV